MDQNPNNKINCQFTRKKIEEFSYGLNDVIGKGYSSHVYKGRHDQTDELVAVKVIDMKMLKNEINRTLLDSEVQILKELKSVPSVLTLHEVYTTKNNTYIITELCSSDLNKKIKAKMTEDEVFLAMDQIIQGYLQIYQKEIVHRDLKPANILITDKDECKIADFGFAIKASELLKPSKYNVGSPLYMAPESLKKNEYSYKTDLWSIGVIFYEMLTGETPWKAKTEKQLLKKIETQRIEDVIQRRKHIFSSLTVDFLTKCLCIQKHRRLQPYELKKYCFRPSNILTETKSNIQNQERSIRLNTSLTSPKNQLISKFNFQNLKTPMSKNTENITTFQTTKHTGQLQASSTKHELKKETIKMISKQLISEIHFCRYLFKLLGRIKESCQKGILKSYKHDAESVEKKYSQFIKHKIEKLISFEFINFLTIDEKTYKEYKQTSDFKKIMKITKQYKERYRAELAEYWNSYFDRKFTVDETNVLMRKMIAAFEIEENSIQKDIDHYSKDVIVLDYLITAKHLLEMLTEGQNYQRFSRKSKIEEIVQGTTMTITFELYQKILERGKDLSSFPTGIHSYNTREIPIKA